MYQGKVFVFEAFDITQHLVLGVILIEHRVCHELTGSCQSFRNIQTDVICSGVDVEAVLHPFRSCENVQHILYIGNGIGFVKSNTNVAILKIAEVD